MSLNQQESGRVVVGVDTGGTFTDFVVLRDDSIQVHKVLSTPENPAQAILKGLRELGIYHQIGALVHGSTVATNAVLERKGARTGLITTAGFRDVLAIGRQARPNLYELCIRKNPELIPRELRVEVCERLDEQGNVLIPLDAESVEAALESLCQASIESVAVCLLFSFANPEHERTIAEQARTRGLAVSVSHEVLPEFREFERTSTVVLNAYVGPLMDRYLGHLEAELPSPTPVRIMQSNGGSISSETARREAARTLLSGPAAGVVGAAFSAQMSGIDQVISFDMGGTSTDVALVDREIAETTDGSIGGYPTKLPMIDIHTVGSGGGSIAWFDEGGALRVGPQSAGADPGPAAYGLGGTLATVTDANVALGRISPNDVFGGAISLSVQRARESLQSIADAIDSSVEEAALGVIRVANANMEAAIRVVSVQRGQDPRRFSLVAFGGAGPLHACELAEALQIQRIIIPSTPGVLSAFGMLAADVRKDYVQTIMIGVGDMAQELDDAFAKLVADGRRDLLAEGIPESKITIGRFVDMRYEGQSFELTVPMEDSLAETVSAFHHLHERRFGYSDSREPVQVVNVRVKAFGQANAVHRPRKLDANGEVPEPVDVREVVFAGSNGPQPAATAVFQRETLPSGSRVPGPSIISQFDTTTMVTPGWTAQMDEVGNLLLERGGHRS